MDLYTQHNTLRHTYIPHTNTTIARSNNKHPYKHNHSTKQNKNKNRNRNRTSLTDRHTRDRWLRDMTALHRAVHRTQRHTHQAHTMLQYWGSMYMYVQTDREGETWYRCEVGEQRTYKKHKHPHTYTENHNTTQQYSATDRWTDKQTDEEIPAQTQQHVREEDAGSAPTIAPGRTVMALVWQKRLSERAINNHNNFNNRNKNNTMYCFHSAKNKMNQHKMHEQQ